MNRKAINRDRQDEQDESKTEKAKLRLLIQNLKSKISNLKSKMLFILLILSIPANCFTVHGGL
jgi:hypothetical protein